MSAVVEAGTASTSVTHPGFLGVGSTPRSLRRWITVIAVVAALVAATATVLIAQRSSALARSAAGTEPLVLDTQMAYTALSDADSSAAGGLLAGPIPPAAVVAQYRRDIATAASSVSSAQQLTSADQKLSAELQTVAVGLPFYTGLVERASSENRLGYPVASAYLGEASGYLRSTILPAAGSAYSHELAVLGANQRQASQAGPVAALLLGAVALVVALLAAQLWVRRRFHRTLNVLLVAATAIVIVTGVVAGFTISAADGAVASARSSGSVPLAADTQARILALQVRADDELTLLTRESVPGYQTDLASTVVRLEKIVHSQPDSRVTRAVQALTSTHARIREYVADGEYVSAVALAVTPTTQPPAGLPQASQALDDALSAAVASAQTSFETSTAAAHERVGVLVGGVGAAVTMAGLLAVLGLLARLREYR